MGNQSSASTSPPEHRMSSEGYKKDEVPVMDEVPEDETPQVEVVNARYSEVAAAPTISSFKDHFTLNLPSSTVRYRDVRSAARVFQGIDDQFVLEETYNEEEDNHSIEIRRIHDTSEGLKILRGIYVIVTAFFTGFLLVFCLQVLLFLFLDLAIQVGATSKQSANWGAALGVILSIIPFVYGLASAMVLAGAFIQDTWRGHPLIKQFGFSGIADVAVEWIFFSFFLGAPLFLMGCCLLAKSEYWWTITSLFWFSCILAFYVIFSANVIMYEIRACWEVSKNRFNNDDDSYWGITKRSILLKLNQAYAGRKYVKYLSIGSIIDAEYTDKSDRQNMVGDTYEENISWASKLTLSGFATGHGMYDVLADEDHERVYTIDDARDVRPYMTAYTWGLEKIFCRPKDSRYIAIVRGPGAVTRAQMKSSVICSMLGMFMIFFLILAALVYLELGAAATMFLLAVGVVVAWPNIRSAYRLYKTAQDLIEWRTTAKTRAAAIEEEQNEDISQESKGLYLVTEVYRISKPRPTFLWVMFIIEMLLFFVWPVVSLLSVGNYPLAALFFVVVFITGLRYYFNAGVVLEETGHMKLVDGQTEQELWQNQSRLSQIVGDVTRGRSRGMWMSILGSLSFVFLALFAGAVGSSQESTAAGVDIGYTYMNDFEYQQRDSLRYPACRLSNALGNDDLSASPLDTMADFTFLAGLAYVDPAVTQRELDGFFTNSTLAKKAVDEQALVDQYRQENEVSSAVSFKLVSFPENGNFSYVLIRGTQNNWDMLTDAQLWSAAALMQVLRAFLPMGSLFTPIIDQLINAINSVESESIDAVSFYKDTTKFTEYVKTLGYNGVAVTGHSLGGGLSMITGAQTKTPAIGLSGPNTMLTRKSLDPMIKADDLDRYTFNIIPERDVVPMIDDTAQNYQSIRCEAEWTDFIGCHDSTRSLCEIMYMCGSNGRPVLCECVTIYGYPEPEPVGDSTNSFMDACIAAESGS